MGKQRHREVSELPEVTQLVIATDRATYIACVWGLRVWALSCYVASVKEELRAVSFRSWVALSPVPFSTMAPSPWESNASPAA